MCVCVYVSFCFSLKEIIKISLLQFNQRGASCLKSRVTMVSHRKFRIPLSATKETGIQV